MMNNRKCHEQFVLFASQGFFDFLNSVYRIISDYTVLQTRRKSYFITMNTVSISLGVALSN
jgi:hypothetical protein